MDSNYKWQHHQANQRYQARMREAEAHRLLKGDSIRNDSLLMRIWKKLRGSSASARESHHRQLGTAEAAFKPRLADRTAE